MGKMGKRKEWLPFEEALKIVRKDAKKYDIATWNEWMDYCHGDKKTKEIPIFPDSVYKNEGWLDWDHWLNSAKRKIKRREQKKKNKWLSFSKAIKKVREDAKKYKMVVERDWIWYRKKGLRPANIPSSPSVIYKDKGWISYRHWLGSEDIPTRRKYIVNDNYFKKWSHDMAYILGFWWADGWISKRKRKNNYSYSFCMGQHKRDRYLLKEMLEEMSSDNPFHYNSKNKNFLIFSITSKPIFESIVRLGGKPRKSLTVKFPKIPRKYVLDFIRGHFDGDGCIYKIKNRDRYRASIESGSEDFIEGLKKTLEKNIDNIRLSIDFRARLSGSCYRLRFNERNTRKLGAFMYNDYKINDLKMLRKYKKFELAEEGLNNAN